MADGFEVSVEALREHAASVEGIASQVSSAGTAAQTSLGGDSFGVIAEFFATAVTAASDQVREAIDTSAQAVMDVRTGLSAAADSYQQIEDTHTQVFRVEGGLGGATTAQATTRAAGGQRDKAVAVLERISRENPISVATVAVRQVRRLRDLVGNVASARIGDHYENDIPDLLAKPPTDANLMAVAKRETQFWNSGEGNLAGRAISESRRFQMLLDARTNWLNEMPLAQRREVRWRLGLGPGN